VEQGSSICRECADVGVGVKSGSKFLYQFHSLRKDPNYELRKFSFHFEEYRDLSIWKMQILDERHLLIQYGSGPLLLKCRDEEHSGGL